MTNTHFTLGGTSPRGGSFLLDLKALAADWSNLMLVHGVMIQMQDTGVTGADVFADIATAFGYPDSATAQASFAEIDSCVNACNTALTQMLARHL